MIKSISICPRGWMFLSLVLFLFFISSVSQPINIPDVLAMSTIHTPANFNSNLEFQNCAECNDYNNTGGYANTSSVSGLDQDTLDIIDRLDEQKKSQIIENIANNTTVFKDPSSLPDEIIVSLTDLAKTDFEKKTPQEKLGYANNIILASFALIAPITGFNPSAAFILEPFERLSAPERAKLLDGLSPQDLNNFLESPTPEELALFLKTLASDELVDFFKMLSIDEKNNMIEILPANEIAVIIESQPVEVKETVNEILSNQTAS